MICLATIDNIAGDLDAILPTNAEDIGDVLALANVTKETIIIYDR